MNAKGSDVGASFAVNPDDTHVSFFVVLDETQLVDCTDAELFLDGRNERWALETGSGQGVKCLLKLLNFVKFGVQLNNSNVLLTGALLSFDQTSCVVDASDEATGNLWVKGATVTCLIDLKNFLYPCYNLVRAGVGWFVQIDNSVVFKDVNWAFSGRVAAG